MPKSTATDIREIASSSRRPFVVIRGHQEVSRLPGRVLHGQIDRGLLVDLRLRVRAQLGQVVRVAEPAQHPLVLRLQQGVAPRLQRGAGQGRLLVEHELEGAGERALDRGPAQLGIPLRGVGVARKEPSLAWWVSTSMVTKSPEATSTSGLRDLLKYPECTVLSLAGTW